MAGPTLRSNHNVVFQYAFHVVWSPKYRRSVLVPPVDDPQFGVHRLVKALKGRSSRVLRQEFPQLRRRLPTLWTNAYFVATIGGAPLAVIKRYVENQRHV